MHLLMDKSDQPTQHFGASEIRIARAASMSSSAAKSKAAHAPPSKYI